MKILDYYLSQQKNPIWYQKFQSTSSKQSGKTFSYINTNYRGIDAFFKQMSEFYKKNGLERSEWNDKQKTGQEKDKHRVINLLNAGFFKFETNCYLITPKGQAIVDLLNIPNVKEHDRWILLYLLLLDYKTEERDLDIIHTTEDIFSYITKAGYSNEEVSELMYKGMSADSKEDLFLKDIFWLVSFAKDDVFLSLYAEATDNERESLGKYVSAMLHTKDTQDCIAHKFINGGSYTVSTFVDDLKVLYFTNILLQNRKLDFDSYIEIIVNKYSEKFFSFHKDFVLKFIKNHKSIYKSIFNKIVNY